MYEIIKEHLWDHLQDRDEATAYLNASLDDDPHVFLLALRDIPETQGGMSWLAEQADLKCESLYRTLSLHGNPRFFNLLSVLEAVGLELSIHPKPRKRKNCLGSMTNNIGSFILFSQRT